MTPEPIPEVISSALEYLRRQILELNAKVDDLQNQLNELRFGPSAEVE